MIAAQTGTDWKRIVLKKWYTSYKDHIKLSDYEIHNGMSLELYYVWLLRPLQGWIVLMGRAEMVFWGKQVREMEWVDSIGIWSYGFCKCEMKWSPIFTLQSPGCSSLPLVGGYNLSISPMFALPVSFWKPLVHYTQQVTRFVVSHEMFCLLNTRAGRIACAVLVT